MLEESSGISKGMTEKLVMALKLAYFWPDEAVLAAYSYGREFTVEEISGGAQAIATAGDDAALLALMWVTLALRGRVEK